MLAVVVQRPYANTALCTERLTRQPALLKLQHQSLGFNSAPTATYSYTNQLAHATSPSHFQSCQKGVLGLTRAYERQDLDQGEQEKFAGFQPTAQQAPLRSLNDCQQFRCI
jgi:hypothetical protein